MNDLLATALAGVLAPAIVTALLLGRLWRRGPGETRSAAAIPLALGLGYLAGHVALNGLPPWRFHVELKDGLFWVALAATVLGVVEARRAAALWPARLLLAAATPWFLLDFMREHHWEGAQGWAWTAGLALALLAAMAAVTALTRARPGPGPPLAWTLACALAGGTLALSGSATLGQLTGALAVAVALGALLLVRHRASTLGPGVTPVLCLILGGLLMGGRYASELSATGACLLALAPLTPGLLELGPPRRSSPRIRFLLGLVLVLAFAGGALALEWTLLPEDPYAAYR